MSRLRGVLVSLLAASLFVAIALAATLIAIENGGAKGLLRTALAAKLQRSVDFTSYKARLLSADPTVILKGLRVDSPPEITREAVLIADTVTIHLRPRSLWLGRIDLRAVAIDRGAVRLVRLGPGQNNYTFGHGGSGRLLRNIESLAITDSTWRMDDPERHVFLSGPVAHAGRPGAAYPLTMSAEGSISEQPVTLVMRGDGLNLRKPDAPWPVEVTVQDGKASIHLKGMAQAPFDFRGFDFVVDSQGPNLSVLGWLLRTEAPNSPAYALTVRARRSDHTVRLSDLRATVGRSDLSGAITSDHTQPRRKITADLSFGTLHAEDLAILASPVAPHAVARSMPGRKPPTGEIVGMDKPVPIAGLRKLDTEISLRAKRVEGYALPLRELALRLLLRGGRLDANPISFQLPTGEVRGALSLDARGAVPRGSVDLAVQAGRLSALRPQLRQSLDGSLRVAIAVSGAGQSTRAMLADASGRATLFGSGRMQRAAAAALSGDSLDALSAGAAHDTGMVAVECALGTFRATHGALESDALRIVTAAGTSQGSARLSLAGGTLDARLEGTPSRRFAGPSSSIVVTGDLAHPKVSVNKGAILAGAAVSVLTTPLAMLVPRRPVSAQRCQSAEREATDYMAQRGASAVDRR